MLYKRGLCACKFLRHTLALQRPHPSFSANPSWHRNPPARSSNGTLTRFLGNNKHMHTNLATEHYAVCSSVPGTLSEATFIAHKASGQYKASGQSSYVPGIWSDEQIAPWKKVCLFLRLSSPRSVLNTSLSKMTDAGVHANGSSTCNFGHWDVLHLLNSSRKRALLSSTSPPGNFLFPLYKHPRFYLHCTDIVLSFARHRLLTFSVA